MCDKSAPTPSVPTMSYRLRGAHTVRQKQQRAQGDGLGLPAFAQRGIEVDAFEHSPEQALGLCSSARECFSVEQAGLP